MADTFKMLKQAASMRKQMKKMQKALAKETVEASSGDVRVVARGDMTIKSVEIAPEAFDAPRKDRLEKMIAAAVNNALESAKKLAGTHMQNSGGMGAMSDMLGM